MKLPSDAGDADPTRIWNQTFTSIFIANVLMSIGLQIGNVLIGKYTNHLGASATLVGVVTSAFAWTSIVFKLISGPTLDAFNRKRVIVIALCVTGFSFVGCGMSTTIPALFVFRMMEGIGVAFTTTAFVAMAADALPRNKTSTGLGIYALAASFAQMIGPLVSLHVSEWYGYRPAFFIASMFLAFAIVATSKFRVAQRPRRPFQLNVSGIFAPQALIPAVIMMLIFCCYSLVDPFLPIQASERGIGGEISLFFTVYAIVLLVSRPSAGWLTDRIGYVTLLPMFAFFIAALWLISSATSLPMFLCAAALFGFGYGGCQPVLQSLAMRLVPPDRRGAASGTNFVGSDLGKIIGPIVGGNVADNMGLSSMWQVMSITVLAAAMVFVVCRKKIRKDIDIAAQ